MTSTTLRLINAQDLDAVRTFIIASGPKRLLSFTTLKTTPVLLGVFAFVLYVCTLAPTFGWGDSADLAMRMVYDGDHFFAVGSRGYPFYLWVGSLFQLLPIGDAGTRANIMSAFFGAVTIGLVASLSGYITRSLFATLASGIALMVAHTFWFMSVTAEVYTFNAVLIFGCYAFIALWWRTQYFRYLIAATLFAGLALSHHTSGLVVVTTIAPLISLRIKSLRIWQLALLICLFILTSALYIERTLLYLSYNLPLVSALGLISPKNLFFQVSPLKEFFKFIAYSGYNFMGFGFLLGVWGIILTWQKKMWEMLPPMLWLIIMVYVGVTSSIPDKFI